MIRFMGRALILFFFTLGGLSAQVGVEGYAMDLPEVEAPEDGLRDADGLYRTRPKERDMIVNALQRLSEEHGFDLYVVTNSGLIGTSAAEMARHHQQMWLGKKNDGLLIEVDVSGDPWYSVAKSDELYSGAYVDLGLYPRLEEYQLKTIVDRTGTKISAEFDEQVTPKNFKEKRAEALAAWIPMLAKEIGKELEAKKNASSTTKDIRFMGWLSLVLLGLFALGFLLTKLFSKAEVKAKRTYQFPDVLVGERLGANFGGGKVSSVVFRSPHDGQ